MGNEQERHITRPSRERPALPRPSLPASIEEGLGTVQHLIRLPSDSVASGCPRQWKHVESSRRVGADGCDVQRNRGTPDQLLAPAGAASLIVPSRLARPPWAESCNCVFLNNVPGSHHGPADRGAKPARIATRAKASDQRTSPTTSRGQLTAAELDQGPRLSGLLRRLGQ
ncbi:hypothetical protein CDD83_7928 [Cordyceps sp. RAO-2017]|nr:hypothetical protein CDD83_7928 [Cordyceps sp. RAO-2017]